MGITRNNLWSVLRESIGFNGSGHCIPWTKLATAILSEHPTIRVSQYASSSKGNPHYYLMAEVPEGNVVEVEGDVLERICQQRGEELNIKNAPNVSGQRLVGYIPGGVGGKVVLDGSADQMFTGIILEIVKGGFYGSADWAPNELRQYYQSGFQCELR